LKQLVPERVIGGLRIWVLLLAGAPLLLAAGPNAPKGSGGLDKKAEEWLQDVRLLILPEEEAVFRSLEDAGDRAEFQRIFWARRSPDPRGAKAEPPEPIRKARARADDLFGISGKKGSRTGCGEVYQLLGEPDEIAGREVRARFDSLRDLREGSRRPETWIYKSRPDRAFSLPGGELRLELDDACRFAEAARIMDELRRLARAQVRHPQLDYARGPDGRLRRLEDALAAGSPGRGLVAADHADFPIAVEPKLLLRSQNGQGFAAGLVRGSLPGPAGPMRVLVAAQARTAGGEAVSSFEREVTATREADGSFLAAYGVAVDPGRYDLKVGLRVVEGGQAATSGQTLEVPRFDGAGLVVSPLFLTPDADGAPGDPNDPFAPFVLAGRRMVPRFGNAFTAKDGLQAVAVVYGAAVDPASGKASVLTRYRLLKDGRPVARDSEQRLETGQGVASIGPVPLGGFGPGRYVLRLEVTDERAHKDDAQEAVLEVRP
jgi:GWxTD domain-containing protein